MLSTVMLLLLDTSWNSGDESNQNFGQERAEKNPAGRPKTVWLSNVMAML